MKPHTVSIVVSFMYHWFLGVYSPVRETLNNKSCWHDSSHRWSQKRETGQPEHIKIRQKLCQDPPTCPPKQHENQHFHGLGRVGFLQPQSAFQSQNLVAHSGYLALWRLLDLKGRQGRTKDGSKRSLSNSTQLHTLCISKIQWAGEWERTRPLTKF